MRNEETIYFVHFNHSYGIDYYFVVDALSKNIYSDSKNKILKDYEKLYKIVLRSEKIIQDVFNNKFLYCSNDNKKFVRKLNEYI